MPGGRTGGNNNRRGQGHQERRNQGTMRSWITKRRPDGTVTKDLAGRAITLLAAGRLGVPVSLAYGCCRC